jgi:hypothetical protein
MSTGTGWLAGATVALTASTLLAGGLSVTQGTTGGTTRTVTEHTSARARDPGWKMVTHVVNPTAPGAFRWSLAGHPEEEWAQGAASAGRAAFRVRSVQGPLALDTDAGVAFAGDPLSPIGLPSHAAALAGRTVRAQRSYAAIGGRIATVGDLAGDSPTVALFERGQLVFAAASWVEKFDDGWLYVWRVRNGTDEDHEFDWGAAPVQGPDGWSGTVAAHADAVAVRFDRARPRSEYAPLVFTVPGTGHPDTQSAAFAYRPAPRRRAAARPVRGYPPALSVCGDIDASLLSGEPSHDALVVRDSGRVLVETESTVERVGERWGYVWRVRNATSEDLTFAWPSVPGEGESGWTVDVAAGSSTETRLIDDAPPFVAQGGVAFTAAGTGDERFRTSAAAYVPRPATR